MSHPFYRLTAPAVWATEVGALSFSSLHLLEQCPLRWQLLRSTWEGFAKLPVRLGGAALEGTLVHEALDRLFRAHAVAGLPAQGTPAFATVMRATDILGWLRASLAEADAALAEHPRRAALRLPHDALSLYNRVAQLFRQSYAQVHRAPPAPPRTEDPGAVPEGDGLARLRARGVLTEWPVRHPTLPLRGVVDLVQRTDAGTRIVDFKTGPLRPEYEEQLSLYALLWWRSTGDLPVSLAVQRPDGETTFAVGDGSLVALESALRGRIDAARSAVARTPAEARTGEGCARCDVRAFCDAYWALPRAPMTEGAWVDVSLEVPSASGEHGFVARIDEREVPVVWSEEHGPFSPRTRLRVLGARVDAGALQIVRSSEVFARDPSRG